MSFGTGVWVVQLMRKHRKDLNARKSEAYFDKNVDNDKIYRKFEDHKKMSPAQFAAFKAKVEQQEANRLKRLTITFGIALVIIVTAVVYFLFYY